VTFRGGLRRRREARGQSQSSTHGKEERELGTVGDLGTLDRGACLAEANLNEPTLRMRRS
jgi:hypothetical protein